jgi:hypothetical protein
MIGKSYLFEPMGGTDEYKRDAYSIVTHIRCCSPPLRDHFLVEFPDGTVRPVCTRDLLA